jgi:hypothetical protein
MHLYLGFVWGIVLALLIGVGCAAPVQAPAQTPFPQAIAPVANPIEQLPPTHTENNLQQPLPPEADIDFVGIWTSEEATQYGVVYAETILERNNDYSHQVHWNDLLTYETGEYETGPGYIHFTVQDYQPKTYKGTELSRPLSWTVWYTVIDENTMRWEDRTLNTNWLVTRRAW